MFEINVKTKRRIDAVDITEDVRELVSRSGVRSGFLFLYVPHTTAGITINEGADPDVMRDVLETLSSLVPSSGNYRHTEGNADSHIKSTLTNCSAGLIVEDGKVVLGTWQKIFFLEFDGPRSRKILAKVIGSGEK